MATLPGLIAIAHPTDPTRGLTVNADGSFNATLVTTADITVVAAGSYTTTQTQADQTAPFGVRGLRVVLDMTDVSASPSVTLEIDAKDVASGKYVALLTGAAVVTVTTNVYVIYPTITAVVNSIAQTALPHTWRVKVTANNANNAIYSVGASYLY